MAFHTACPITCRRICYCELGFPEGLEGERSRGEFFDEVVRVEEFLRDPWLLRDGRGSTVQVPVPRVTRQLAAAAGEVTPLVAAAVTAEDGYDETAAATSAQAKRSALQRQAAAASLAAEEYVRRLEAGNDSGIPGEAAIDLARGDQSSSAVKIICRICFSGENKGSKRAIKMLSCKFCNKKYHRSCLKIWAEYRDLFHWSSWACPSCRICEVCRRAGDPTKLMYCKRCDAAYHCYCQQPPHKNNSHGPYLCPKHTRCHSCGSTVSGSGHSTRWFLSYTCCDACGRLFVKGKYCPVCLKVYRDSELTPMVCCDVCQQWVHCVCDSISNEKYQQFQTDRNLSYNCPACRGDCYQVKDMDDAVRELWRRRDKADRNLIVSLRSAAGLPIEEEIFSISPCSDDDEDDPVMMKNDHRRSLKFSLKGFADKTSKSSKEYVKNSPHSLLNKKYAKKGYRMQPGSTTYQNIEVQHEARSSESSFKDQKNAHTKSWRRDGQGILSSPTYESPGNDKNKPLVDQEETRSNIKEASVNNISKVSKVHIKGSKAEGLHLKESPKNVAKNETSKGTKLVIHFGAKYRNATASPMSEASSGHKDLDVAAANGSGDTGQQKDGNSYNLEPHGDIRRLAPRGGPKLDNATRTTGSKHEMREVKLRKLSDMHGKDRANVAIESATQHASPLTIRKKRTENEEILPRKHSGVSSVNVQSQAHDVSEPFASNSFDDPKPLLKLKFKNPYFEQQSSWAAQGVEEKNTVKGQRSKRKRPLIEKSIGNQDHESPAQQSEKKLLDEVMDANWILQKLGKDAIGKRVEVHQPSDNSWHKGVVTDFIKGTDSLSVHFDDGRFETVDLQKQGVRFIAQKQKRAKVSIIKTLRQSKEFKGPRDFLQVTGELLLFCSIQLPFMPNLEKDFVLFQTTRQ